MGDKVYGIDVSHYQKDNGGIDWDNIALYCDEYGNVSNRSTIFMQPVFFAYLKATDGDTIDVWYDDFNKEAKDHHIFKGAYHFFRTEIDIKSQVKIFLSTDPCSEGDLPPALDVEDAVPVRMKDGTKTIKYQIREYVQNNGIEKFHEMVLRWLDAVEQELGVQPIIYTNNECLKEYLNALEFKKYRFWVARYNVVEPSYSDWQFWQKSETARMRGYAGDIDVNLFRGNYYSFDSYIKAVGKKAKKAKKQ